MFFERANLLVFFCVLSILRNRPAKIERENERASKRQRENERDRERMRERERERECERQRHSEKDPCRERFPRVYFLGFPVQGFAPTGFREGNSSC